MPKQTMQEKLADNWTRLAKLEKEFAKHTPNGTESPDQAAQKFNDRWMLAKEGRDTAWLCHLQGGGCNAYWQEWLKWRDRSQGTRND